jgi:hypothetical protein
VLFRSRAGWRDNAWQLMCLLTDAHGLSTHTRMGCGMTSGTCAGHPSRKTTWKPRRGRRGRTTRRRRRAEADRGNACHRRWLPRLAAAVLNSWLRHGCAGPNQSARAARRGQRHRGRLGARWCVVLMLARKRDQHCRGEQQGAVCCRCPPAPRLGKARSSAKSSLIPA